MIQMQVEHANFSPVRRLKVPEAKAAFGTIVAAIEAHKPDVNYRDENGETALICGAKSGIFVSWDVYSKEGKNPDVDVNARRPDGMTALMLAVLSQTKNASKTGPGSVTVTDKKDNSETHYSESGHTVKSLLDLGADLNLRNNVGKTALDFAKEIGNEEVLQLLEDAVKRKPAK
jgi:ankyrin repeat protein